MLNQLTLIKKFEILRKYQNDYHVNTFILIITS